MSTPPAAAQFSGKQTFIAVEADMEFGVWLVVKAAIHGDEKWVTDAGSVAVLEAQSLRIAVRKFSPRRENTQRRRFAAAEKKLKDSARSQLSK